ncbi:MAG: hypothetical protein QF569_27880, partial [Candidatus Poribacteria bacterium]|nr:hypothetical protein [Candidatus Poribacteria bacterium]
MKHGFDFKLPMSKLAFGLIMLLLAFDARANPIFVVAGKVADSTGAAMVNAKVQVSNQTNTSLETKEATTNAEGLYKILFMDMFDDGDLDNSFISLGDVLKIHVLNASNEFIAEHSWVVMPLQIINKIIESNIQLFSLVEDIPQTINFSPVDSTKTVAKYKILSPSDRGQLSAFDSATGQVLYSPEGNYSGTDSILFEVDYAGGGGSDQVVAKITVSAVNDAPFVSVGNSIEDLTVWAGDNDITIDLATVFSDPDIASLPTDDQQSTDVLTIAGNISDSSGTPLSGSHVQITNQTQLEVLPESITNTDGTYEIVRLNIDQAGPVAFRDDTLLVEVFDSSGTQVLIDNYQLTGLDIAQRLADISFRGNNRVNWFSIRESLNFECQITPSDQPFVTATIHDQSLILDITDDLRQEGEIEVTLQATDMSQATSPPESFKVEIKASALQIVGQAQGELSPGMQAYAIVSSAEQERFDTIDEIAAVDSTSGQFTILLYEDAS